MAKKKKMTKAQAAAARRDTGRRHVAPVTPMKDEGPKSKDTALFAILIPVITIVAIIILSAVFTIGPGMLLNQ